MDITAARRGLAGAEAILKPRAIKANRDFEEYWRYHLAQETPPHPPSGMAALLFRCKVTADERRITALFTPPAWDDEKQRSSVSCFLRAEQDRRASTASW